MTVKGKGKQKENNSNSQRDGELRNRKEQPKGNEVKEVKSNNKSNNKKTYEKPAARGLKAKIYSLFEEEDASYLVVFRVLWGLIMTYEAYTYIIDDFSKTKSSFYSSVIQFKYYGFEWCVVPSNPVYLYSLMVALFVFGLFISIGFFYRTSALLFTIGFGYMYMLEQAMYLNHFYLVTILSVMMVILPCNCFFSVDSYLWPANRKETAPKWCLFLIRAELFIVYTYAGVCKINEDWLRAQPLLQWLSGRESTPLIGHFLVKESTAYFMSYAGMIYDLIVGFLLLFKKLRWFGVATSIFFHCSNKYIFNIGIFPWMMLASTTFFFNPDWPRFVISLMRWEEYRPVKINQKQITELSIGQKIILIAITLFLAHQVFCPLRHLIYPGDVAWNEYGHQFSWRMKLRTKKCELVAMSYLPEIGEGNLLPVQQVLTRRQYRKVPSRPDMMIQLAHFFRDQIDKHLAIQFPNATISSEVYFDAWCELNGRPFQRITNPYIDLTTQEKWQIPYPWVTEVDPLPEELKKGYPWNWEWNFNWLKGIDNNRNWNDKLSPEARYEQMRQTAIKGWRQFLKERNPEATLYGLDKR